MTDTHDFTSLPRLNRAEHGRAAAPVRIIHLGIGNFTRAHQAWYTEHAPDTTQWGIAGFTGRSRRMVDKLAPQDNVYTLITSAPEGDSFEVISSISSMHEGGDMAALHKYFADPNVSIVTSTVTEAGYKRDAHGDLDVNDTDVSEDLAKLRNDVNVSELATVPARIVAGLEARRAANAGAITILPCDNLAGNGAAFRHVVEHAIEAVDPTLLEWTRDNVAWATSMVDRITPATTDAELQTVAQNLADDLRFNEWMIDYDESGAIGRRYRRQDEIGTPLCITVDFDTLEDHAVTIRERDTMAQERIALDKVADYVAARIGEKRTRVPLKPVEMGGEPWPESGVQEAGGLY